MNDSLLKPMIGMLITTILGIWRIPAIRDRAFAWVAKLPRVVQWVAPVSFAMVVAFGEGFLGGKSGEDLFYFAMGSGAEVGAFAIAFWHIYKRIRDELAKKMGRSAGVQTAKAVAKFGLVVFLAALSSGCSFLRSPTFWDGFEKTCEIALTATPEVKAKALATGTPVEEIAAIVCAVADVVDPFIRAEMAAKEGRKLTGESPAQQAVATARVKGLL